MGKKDLESAFISTPLKKALQEESYEEVSEEDMQLAGMGFNLTIVDNFKEEFKKDSVMYQGYPTNDLIDYYLERCNESMVNLLMEHPDSFREKQYEKICNFEVVYSGETVRKAQEDTFAGYIQKNSELIQENQELKRERDYLGKVFDLAKKLVEIFIEQGIKTNKLTQEDIELAKELA